MTGPSPHRGLRVTARQPRRFRSGLEFTREARVVHIEDLPGEGLVSVSALLAILTDPQLDCALLAGDAAIGVEAEMLAEIEARLSEEDADPAGLDEMLIDLIGTALDSEEPAPKPTPAPSGDLSTTGLAVDGAADGKKQEAATPPPPPPAPAPAKPVAKKAEAKPAAKQKTSSASGDAEGAKG